MKTIKFTVSFHEDISDDLLKEFKDLAEEQLGECPTVEVV